MISNFICMQRFFSNFKRQFHKKKCKAIFRIINWIQDSWTFESFLKIFLINFYIIYKLYRPRGINDTTESDSMVSLSQGQAQMRH